MNSKTNLKDIGFLQSLRESMQGDINHADWKIKKHPSGNYLLLEEVGNCTWFSDKMNFLENFFTKIYDREFSSILCGGLGLGVVPSLVQDFCTKVDVIEISQSNIDLIRNYTSHLDPKVNIIQGDVRTFSTSETYDVILLDIWTCDLQAFKDEEAALVSKYTPNLNPGGLLYLPIKEHYSF